MIIDLLYVYLQQDSLLFTSILRVYKLISYKNSIKNLPFTNESTLSFSNNGWENHNLVHTPH